MDLLSRIKELCGEHGISIARLEQETGLANGSIRKWSKAIPSGDRLAKVADYFNVTTDYLLGRELSEKDNKDISKDLNAALDRLENSQEGLMFDGEPIDDETRELLRISLENSMRLAKQIAKKYTPNKYKK